MEEINNNKETLVRAIKKNYLCTVVDDEMPATYPDYIRKKFHRTLSASTKNHLLLHVLLNQMMKAHLNTYK